MLATLVNEPFDEKEWVFETKWDGFRLITEKRGDAVRLWSRNGISNAATASAWRRGGLHGRSHAPLIANCDHTASVRHNSRC